MDEFMATDWLNDSRFSKGKQPFVGPLPSFEPDPLLILSRLWVSRHQTQRSQWRTVGPWKSNGLWWRERKWTRTVQEDWSMLLYRSQHKYGFYMFFTWFFMFLHVFTCLHVFLKNVFTCFTTKKQGFKWLCAGRFHVQTGTPSTNGLLSISKFEKSGQQLGYRSKLGYQCTTNSWSFLVSKTIHFEAPILTYPCHGDPGKPREPSQPTHWRLLILQLLTMANCFILVSGCGWYTYHSEKYESVSWDYCSQHMGKKRQPVYIYDIPIILGWCVWMPSHQFVTTTFRSSSTT